MDNLSAISPARIRALALPVGIIKRRKFYEFLERLKLESVVNLGAVTPDPRPDRNMFSPLSFANGQVFYDFSIHLPTASCMSLSPYELFREPLAIVGIADCHEYYSPKDASVSPTRHMTKEEIFVLFENLLQSAQALWSYFPGALVHKLFIFDSHSGIETTSLPNIAFCVPESDSIWRNTVKTYMCDLTSILLADMTSLAKSIRALPTITAPSLPSDDVDESVTLSPALKHLFQEEKRMALLSNQMNDGTGVSEGYSNVAGGTTDAQTLSRDFGGGGLQGFGPDSLSEKWRDKGRCRVGIVIGSMFLQSGCWNKALSALNENTVRAKELGDQLWYTKGLENILVCLLLLAWVGADFQIPAICYSSFQRSSGKSTSVNNFEVRVKSDPSPASKLKALNSLEEILVNLTNAIVDSYNTIREESPKQFPRVAFSESCIRLSQLLAIFHLAGNRLDEKALQQMVIGTVNYLGNPQALGIRGKNGRLSIAQILARAIPNPYEEDLVGFTDHMRILSSMAAVYSLLGMHRKRNVFLAYILELLYTRIGQTKQVYENLRLSRTRCLGWEENILDNEDGVDGNFYNFIMWIVSLHGIPVPVNAINGDLINSDEDEGSHDNDIRNDQNQLPGSLTNYQIYEMVLRSYGSIQMKRYVCQVAIELCRTMLDDQSLLDLTSAYLRLIGPGSMIKESDGYRWTNEDGNEGLEVENQVRGDSWEQIKCMKDIHETIGDQELDGDTQGTKEPLTEYWDGYVLRDVWVEECSPARQLKFVLPSKFERQTGMKKNGNRDSTESKSVEYYSFANAESDTAKQNDLVYLVAEDEMRVSVKLRNPFYFDVEIESISLVTRGNIELPCRLTHGILMANNVSVLTMSTTLTATGTTKIIGCNIKFRGCYESFFPIYTHDLSHECRIKLSRRIQQSGIRTVLPLIMRGCEYADRFADWVQFRRSLLSTLTSTNSLSTKIINVEVVVPKPLLAITRVSQDTSAVFILEGEITKLSISLRNLSPNQPANFLCFEVHDSYTATLHRMIHDKSTPTSDLISLRNELTNPPVMITTSSSQLASISIPPGGESTFEFAIRGELGLSDALLTIFYADSLSNVTKASKRYILARQIIYPISITVRSCLKLEYHDVIPLFHSVNLPITARSLATVNVDSLSHFGLPVNHRNFSNASFCLLILDFQSTWSNPLMVKFTIFSPHPDSHASESSSSISSNLLYTISQTIIPLTRCRFVLWIPKIFVPVVEQDHLYSYAFHTQLQHIIKGEWSEVTYCTSPIRHGSISLKTIKLSPTMIRRLSIDDLHITLSPINSTSRLNNHFRASQFIPTFVDECLTLSLRILNRSTRTINSILHVNPMVSSSASPRENSFIWSGCNHQPLETLHPGDVIERTFTFIPLICSEFKFDVHVEILTPVTSLPFPNVSCKIVSFEASNH